MQINAAVLEVFDFTSSMAAYSDHTMDIEEPEIQSYLEMHVMKALQDPSARTGYISSHTPWGRKVQQFHDKEINLVDFGKELGETLFTYMAQAMDPCVLDMIVCEAQGEQPYLCILLCKAHDGYTHQLYSEEDGSLATKLVEHRVVLPTVTQKLYAFVSIKLSDMSIRLFEPKGEYDGEKMHFLEERIFQVTMSPSSKDTVKKVRTVVDRISKAHEQDGVAAMAKTKELLAKNAEVSDTLEARHIIEHVFGSNPIQREAAMKALAEEDLLEPLPVSRTYATKMGKQHKIKTDTGIEISFPVEYMNDREFIEISTNENGTLKIELKNISKIINK